MRETELWRLREGQREQKFFFDFVLLIFNLLSAFHSLRNKTIIHMLNLLLLLFQWETNKYARHYINKTSIIFLFFFLALSLFVKASKTNRRKIISFFLFCSTHRKRKKPLGREKKPYIPVHRPWIVLVLLLVYFRSDEDEYQTRLARSYVCSADTNCVGQLWKKLTKTALLMIQWGSSMQTNSGKQQRNDKRYSLVKKS